MHYHNYFSGGGGVNNSSGYNWVIDSSGGGGGGSDSGGGGGIIDKLARIKNKTKQIPETNVKRKFPTTIPVTQKRKLKPEIIDETTLRLIRLIFF